MARTESISVNVAPEKEQEAIQKHELFGWTLHSSQEIYSKDSHLEEQGDTLWSVTNTTNYVKLVFQRDAGMKDIARIRELEAEYWPTYKAIQYIPTDLAWKWKLGLPALGLLIGGITQNVPLLIGGFLLGLGIVIGYHVLVYNKRFNRWVQWRKECADIEAQVAALGIDD